MVDAFNGFTVLASRGMKNEEFCNAGSFISLHILGDVQFLDLLWFKLVIYLMNDFSSCSYNSSQFFIP